MLTKCISMEESSWMNGCVSLAKSCNYKSCKSHFVPFRVAIRVLGAGGTRPEWQRLMSPTHDRLSSFSRDAYLTPISAHWESRLANHVWKKPSSNQLILVDMQCKWLASTLAASRPWTSKIYFGRLQFSRQEFLAFVLFSCLFCSLSDGEWCQESWSKKKVELWPLNLVNTFSL